MSDENPYRPPAVSDPVLRPKRRHLGPIAAGVIAIVVATILTRGEALIPAILGVGSWWLFKFWPRKSAPDDPSARAFLERLEHSQSMQNDDPTADEGHSREQPLDGLRDLRL
jgi:hypothetical protein